ncbi:hypothetical protein IFT64_03265 [Oxalobacteraceae sp. CFBP 8753]|nr:hypothetical protein [Oxalobacteraceae sp. CFBP 8753]
MDIQIEVNETVQDRFFWLGQGLAHNNLAEVSSADLLIVPLKDFREGIPFAFHQDTASLARFLAKKMAGQAKVEVLADDEEYLELALHGASFRFCTIFVSVALAPLLINLLSSYIYDELKAKPSDTIEMSVVIEDHQCRSMHIGFKGDAKDFNSVVDKVSELSHECMTAKPAADSNTQSSARKSPAEIELQDTADDGA